MDKVGLIVLEKQFKNSLEHLLLKIQNNILLDYDNYYNKNILLLFLRRRCIARNLKKKILAEWDFFLNLDKIIISNSEGFIAQNFIYWVRHINPDIDIISLQHGKFRIASSHRLALRKIVNFLTFNISGFYLFGLGFFNKNIDEYVVYNRRYKNLLIENFGDHAKSYFVSSSFVKGKNALKSYKKVNHSANSTLFLMQPLAVIGYCNIECQNRIIDDVMTYLIKKYKNIIIKQHPFNQSDYLINKYGEYIFTGSLAEISPTVKFVYSFFSEALHELEHEDRYCSAIMHNDINIKSDIYLEFPNILNLRNGKLTPVIIENSTLGEYLEDTDLELINKRYFTNADF